MNRRRPFNRTPDYTGEPLSSLGKKELMNLAYYLYQVTDGMHNEQIFNNENAYKMLFSLVKLLGVTERFTELLELRTQDLETEGLLNLYVETEDEDTGMKRSRRHYKYFEDYDITDALEVEITEAGEPSRNYFRCLFCEQKGTFAKLLGYTFFSDLPPVSCMDSCLKISIPKAVKKNAESYAQIKFLSDAFELSVNESRYLLQRYRRSTIQGYGDLIDSLVKNPRDKYCKLLGISSSEYEKIVRNDQKLVQYEFIYETNHELNEDLLEVIRSKNFDLYFSDVVERIDLSNTYELESFNISETKTKIFNQLLSSENAVNVLFYGKPGSGKTEYAKALCKASGKKVLLFKNKTENERNASLSGKLYSLLSLKNEDFVVVVDEAENLLKTVETNFFGGRVPTKNKGVVNQILEKSKSKAIFIVNNTSVMDDSTLRRFTISNHFDQMSEQMLEKITLNKLAPLSVSEYAKGEILKKLNKYKITGASVENIVKTITSMPKLDDEELLEEVEIVLSENSLLLNGKQKIRSQVSLDYDLSVLNTDLKAEKLVQMLENALAFKAKNQKGAADPGNGIRLLFYGLSGTGKTELARYISQKLGKKLLLKRASDIFDKYVGGTEANIASAFEEAQATDQILLFDEADSFFADRENAVRSWERTQVNEFLTQMEEFPGIVICTTNLRNIMDKAMLRRFQFTVEFKALKEDGIKTLLEKYFSSFKFSEEMTEKLCKYKAIVPGDFGRLAGRIRFMNQDEINAELIINELCNIQKEKQGTGDERTIGFAC